MITRHFTPARLAGVSQLILRAGDIHRELGLSSAMPAVCSVLGGRLLREGAGVGLIGREGPANGANVFFTYALDGADDRLLMREAAEKPAAPRHSSPVCDFDRSLVLVSCTKSKLAKPALARDLYTSAFFRMARGLIERYGADWRILSAEHGLIVPTAIIAPYDRTLNEMPVSDRRAWARDVLRDLMPLARKHDRLIILAGLRYRECLVEPLADAGVTVEIPMAGLRQGQQLAWLARQ